MSKHYDHREISGKDRGRKTSKSRWITALKVTCWVVGALVVIAGAIIAGFAIYFSPSRIKHLIEEESGKYLRADIQIGKLDYRLFSTYPWLKFEVDSLTVISKSLDSLPLDVRQSLPQNYDSLAFVEKIKGTVNVKDLLHKNLRMKDIEIERPWVNIVMANDSAANFNIAPSLKAPSKLPKVDISEIKIEAPVCLNYFSLQDDATGKMKVEDFYWAKEPENLWKIGFNGIIDGRWGAYNLPSEVPIRFKTELKPDLAHLSLNLQRLFVGVAGVDIDVTGEMVADKTGFDVKEAQISFALRDVFEFISELPEVVREKIWLPEGMSGFLPLKAEMSLLSPYHISRTPPENFSFSQLPHFLTSLMIANATLELQPKGHKKVEADDISLDADLWFNPENSEETVFEIKELRLNGEGIALAATGTVGNLTGSEQNMTGEISFQSPIMETLTYFLPKMPFKTTGHLKGDVKFQATSEELGKSGFKDINISGNLSTPSLRVKNGNTEDVRFKKLASTFKAIVPSYPLNNNYAGLKMDLDLSADSLIANVAKTTAKIGKLDVKLDAMDTVSGNPDPYGDLLIKVGSLIASANGNNINLNQVEVKANGELNSNGPGNYTTVAENNGPEDELISSRVAHTPLVVEYNGGGILQTIISMVNLEAEIKIGQGKFKMPAYLFPIEFSGIKASTNLNNIKLSAANVAAGKTSFAITGTFDGLSPFLTSYAATPLKVDADINFTNVDINQLSYGYYGALLAQGKDRDSVFYVASMTPLTAADSVCVAIPRNIEANIHLNSAAAEYMGYNFAPLSTDIVVKDGDATLGALTIGTPYCTAIVDWTYSTHRLENIFMDLKAKIKDFRFSPFYEIFPSLTQKASELHNFTGEINADIACRFGMFPDMFMDSESLRADFHINGTHLQFARQGKIEKITHVMLIEGDAPILIHNLSIAGFYHDNLLQINPFKVAFDDYELEVGGVNNISGKMYYHLALEKSPFHLPFGVSLLGNFKHPEVRLGGTKINDYKSEFVADDLTKKINANIMAYLHHGWLLFVQEAAKYGEQQASQQAGGPK